MRARVHALAYTGTLLGLLGGCTDAPVAVRGPLPADVMASLGADTELATYMDALNAQLEAEGASYRAAIAEYVTVPDSGIAGNTVVSRFVGNKRLDADFVPFDARRSSFSGPVSGPADDVTFAVDQTIDAVPPLGGLTEPQTTSAITAAMATWDDVRCSTLPLTLNPSFGLDIGVVAYLNGLGGSPFILADVQHAGWRDINFAGSILGVTFTFVFITPTGEPTDIDNNGLADVALREIYYDPSFTWRTNGGNVDVESVVLHESGHGLSQEHFGTVGLKNDGTVYAAPRAVMNALYTSPLRVLLGTDIGGHCGNWEAWPFE